MTMKCLRWVNVASFSEVSSMQEDTRKTIYCNTLAKLQEIIINTYNEPVTKVPFFHSLVLAYMKIGYGKAHGFGRVAIPVFVSLPSDTNLKCWEGEWGK